MSREPQRLKTATDSKSLMARRETGLVQSEVSLKVFRKLQSR